MSSFLDYSMNFITLSTIISSIFSTKIADYNEFLGTIVTSNYFKSIAILCFILVYMRVILRKLVIMINYRLRDNPEVLDLKGSELNEFNYVYLFLDNEIAQNIFIKLLSLLKFKLIIAIEYPPGIKLNTERLTSEFVIFKEFSTNLVLAKDISASGRRKVELCVQSDSDAAFVGGSPIRVNVYICPKIWLCSQLLSLIVGTLATVKINITTS